MVERVSRPFPGNAKGAPYGNGASFRLPAVREQSAHLYPDGARLVWEDAVMTALCILVAVSLVAWWAARKMDAAWKRAMRANEEWQDGA